MPESRVENDEDEAGCWRTSDKSRVLKKKKKKNWM